MARDVYLDQDVDLRSFQLIFEGVNCDECGETQPVTRTCRCGAWQPRADEHVAHRRAAVEPLRARLKARVAATTPIELEAAIDTIQPWIAELFEGLNALGGPDAQADGVEHSIEVLTELRARVAAVPRRRPWLALWDPLRSVLEALASLAGVELDAAAAPDPPAAQATEATAQARLDEAAKAIHILSSRLDWWGIEKTVRIPDSLVQAAATAYADTGASDLLDLDRMGQPLYARISGHSDSPAGIGVGLLLDLGQVDRAFDEPRVYAAAQLVYRRLDRHRKDLAALLDDAGWRADLLNARRVFYESQLSAETLLFGLAGERRMEAQAVLHLGAWLTERVSACLVGLIVAVDPACPVKRTADYALMHKVARDAGLGDLLLGFDDRIRNADAHADFDVAPDHVVLGRNRSVPVRFDDDELVDTVLAAVESSAAMFAGLDCVIAELDHPSGRERFAELPVEDRVQILLAVAGVQAQRVDQRAARLEVSGTALASAAVRPLTVIATIAPHLPPEIRSVRFHLKRRDATLRVEAALGPLRRFQSGDGIAKETAFVEFLARSTINERPVFSRRHARFVAATFAYRYIDVPLAAAEADLQEVLAAARRLGDSDLAESLAAFLVAKRAREGGPAAPRAARRAIERLAKYVGTPPGPWDDGSPRDPNRMVAG